MTTVATLLAAARRSIPPSEARLLLGHLLGRNSAWLEAHRDDALEAAAAAQFSALVARRAAGEPVAYLTGRREFYGRDFAVTPDVLIPRPETELLVEIAVEKVGAGGTAHSARPSPALTGGETSCAQGAIRILDLGTGSGCLAITLALELPAAQVTAVEASPRALAVARANAERLGAKVAFVESDWFAALPPQTFDLIVANPPYVAANDPHLGQGDLRFEPADALTDHADGLTAIRRIVAAAPRWLAEGGWLFFEHGWDQADAARALLETAGFEAIEQARDLAGIVRMSGGRKPAARAPIALVPEANNQ
ncbi:MAG: peptide chain release factor N(5)-glutamine methyltransferase [Rhodocyclaceae bacterium]|jgi:release factor glutamine methyltransferase|nr:peptide chain release factor N(5)-glutamine methyltransferase [Rhodocyclaceae bacterium]